MNISRWEIWLANLDPVVGSEQGKTRPVLVISSTSLNKILPVINVLPITSRKENRRIYPNEAFIPNGFGGLSCDSIVLCYQIRTLDKKRLIRKFGLLDDRELKDQIIEALKFQIDID